jgi:Uncharacterized protein conserved in bacteria (DUF2252)
MDIFDATRAYESWLARHTAVVRKDLQLKHERLAENSFVFLRGTFYRWIQQWPAACAKVADAPAVLSVGDLHIENFGTWRDAEGRLIWGVNDFDEACRLPYSHDLVRLAASTLLAIESHRLHVSARDACEAILEGYATSCEQGGRPVVLAERRRWLRRLALNELRDPVEFWTALLALRPVTTGAPHDALRSMMPDPKLLYRVARRVAGVGSLGRPRFVALAEWGGGLVAREAKAAVPSALVWIRRGEIGTSAAARLLKQAIRVPDPFFAVHAGWVVRRLAPDCSRIELSDLPKRRDEQRLLRTMGWETANVHIGTNGAAIRADLRRRPRRWLADAALRMTDAVSRDWRAWVRGRPAR